MRVAAISWCSDIPGLQVYIFRRLSTDLAKNHMEGPSSFPVLLAEWVDKKFVKINYSDSSIVFWNGSKIFLCHCQYEKDKYKYQGAEIHCLLTDELTHFTDSIYRYLRGRVRMAGLNLPEQYKGKFPRIINGSNPGGTGHNWVKSAFVDQGPMTIIRQPKTEGGMLRQYIPARMEDNPTLLDSDPEYMERLEGLGNPALVKAMKSGDWNIVDGGMFDDVWREDVHVLEPFEIPKSWRVDRSFDWGSSKPFSVGWWAESDGTEVVMKDGIKRNFPRGTLFRISEWYGWNGKPNEGLKMLAGDIAKGIKEREAAMGLKVVPGPADNAIFDTQDGNCIADNMASQGVRWERSDKSPGSRKNGWELLRGRLASCMKHPMEEPGVFVFSNCRQFIRTFPTLPRDESKTDDVDCFVGGTMISTPHGAVPVESLVPGDLVNTPIGARRVLKAGAAGKSATVTVLMADGTKLEGTQDHKIYIKNHGLIPLCKVSLHDELLIEEDTLWLKNSISSVLNLDDIQGDTILSVEREMLSSSGLPCFTELSGRVSTERSLTGTASTTKTITPLITALKTFNWSLREIMLDTTTKKELLKVGISENLLMLGENQRRGKKFFERTLRSAALMLPSDNLRALIVATLLKRDMELKNIAPKHVQSRLARGVARLKRALFVVFRSQSRATAKKRLRPVVINVDGHSEEKTVYYLTVEQAHLFYANGILSTNTESEDHIADEVRYRVSMPRRSVTVSDGW